VGHCRPIQDTRHFPHGVTGAITGDLHDRRDEFVVPDAAVFRSGHCSQLEPPIVHLERFDELSTMIEQAVLQIDRGERRRQLPHIGGGCANKTAKLAVAPMGRRDRLTLTWNEKLEPLGIVACCLDADRSTFDRSGMGTLGSGPDGIVELSQR
jgi:hypothetical protein